MAPALYFGARGGNRDEMPHNATAPNALPRPLLPALAWAPVVALLLAHRRSARVREALARVDLRLLIGLFAVPLFVVPLVLITHGMVFARPRQLGSRGHGAR